MIRCKVHRRYLAERRPRTPCDDCARMWTLTVEGFFRLSDLGGGA